MRTSLPTILIVTGAALWVVGLLTPRYHDEADYQRRYMALEGPTRSKDFYALREQSLTSSLKFQDYGVTAMLIGALAFSASRWRQLVPLLPQKRITAALLGAFASFVAVAAQVGSLFSDFSRDEFPHWADSLGIPLAGMPVMLGALLIWAAAHCLLVRRSGSFAWHLTLRHANWWLALLILATALILVVSAALGDFWQIIPAALWIAFYFSIWISRSKEEPNSERSDSPERESGRGLNNPMPEAAPCHGSSLTMGRQR